MTVRTLVFGGRHVGRFIANRLAARHDHVAFVTADDRAATDARADGLTVHRADFTTPRTFPDVGEVDVAVAAAETDSANLLLAQHLRTRYDADPVVVLVREPRNHDTFDDADVRTVCVPTTLSDGVDAMVNDSSESNDGRDRTADAARGRGNSS